MDKLVNARLVAKGYNAKQVKGLKATIDSTIKAIGTLGLSPDATLDMVLNAVEAKLRDEATAQLEGLVKTAIESMKALPKEYTLTGDLLDVVKTYMPKKQSREISASYPIVINGKMFNKWSDIAKNVVYNDKPLWKSSTIYTKQTGVINEDYPKKGYGAKAEIGNLKIVRNGAWDIYPVGGDRYVKHDATINDCHKNNVCDVNEIVTDYKGQKAIVINTSDEFTI